MKVQIENIGPFEKKIFFEIPGDVVSQQIDSTYQTLSHSVKLKGFRPGKVPRSILERYYKAQVEDEVFSKLISDTFGKAVQENNLSPVSPPTVVERNFEAGKEFKYTVTVEVKPEVSIEGYKGLEILKEKVTVSEEEVEARLKDLKEAHAQMKPLEKIRPIQDKDCVILDFEGNLAGKPLKEWKANDHLVEVGSKALIGELDRKLIGLSVSEENDIPITLPETYPNKELAGKEIKVHVKIKEIKEKILPALDDEFAKDVGNFNTLAELKDRIRKTIEEQKQARSDQAAKAKILDLLMEKHPFEVPKSLVERQVQNMMGRTKHRLSEQGMKLEDTKLDPQKLQESFRPAAEKEIRGSLILEKIAELEKLAVEPAEIDKRLELIAPQLNQRVEAVKKEYEKEGLLESLRAQMLEEKSLDFLLGQAIITETTASPDPIAQEAPTEEKK